MKQLIEDLRSGRIRLVEAPIPKCGRGELLVRNVASVISPGTEKLMIEMGKKTLIGKAMARPDLVSLAYQKARREGYLNVFREVLSRLDEPLPLGYSSAGIVMEVGKDVRGFRVGDSVACAGAAFASHAEFIAVPESLCTLMPKGRSVKTSVTHEQAAFVMIGGIALHGFRCAQVTFGEHVVVVGLGLIGLLIVQIAEAYGCTTIGIDIDREKVRLARDLGCNHALLLGRDDVETTILNRTEGVGADAVILAAATKDNSPILLAERVARRGGRIVLVGVSDISLTRKAFWDKELSFTVSKASGPFSESLTGSRDLPPELVRWSESRNLHEFMRLLGNGSVRVLDLITHRYPVENSPDAYKMILGGKERYIGVVIQYPEATPRTPTVRMGRGPDRKGSLSHETSVRFNVGVIGAGMFTKNILMPVIRGVDGVRLLGVSSKTGLSSQHLAEKFRFDYATTDYKQILSDERIGSVVITTRHNLHGPMVAECIDAGKNLFVEKPLCLTHADLDRIVAAFAQRRRDVTIMVGFNRRYAPLAVELQNWLKGRVSPLQLHYRINAGFIPRDHWTQDPEIGGGRIMGEVCHFVDFIQFLTGSDPIEVFAYSIGGDSGRYSSDDNVALSIRMSDGSLATILYTALGPKTFSRERVEVYAEDGVAVLEDFRTLYLAKATSKKNVKLRNQDMGYADEIGDFLHGDPAESGAKLRQAVLTTMTTLGAVESLRRHLPVSIPQPGVVQ